MELNLASSSTSKILALRLGSRLFGELSIAFIIGEKGSTKLAIGENIANQTPLLNIWRPQQKLFGEIFYGDRTEAVRPKSLQKLYRFGT
jgi:hypothetical protein